MSTDPPTPSTLPSTQPPSPPHTASNGQYPSLRPGGSLLLAWQLKNKRVLLVGGGHVAAGRLTNVLEADAYVTLVCPSAGLSPEVEYRIFHDPWARVRITYYDRAWFGANDLELDGGADMVLTAIDDPLVSREICNEARKRRIPVNVADVPPECDFYFGSQIRDGPLQVLVSTGGKGPKIANIIRRKIERSLPKDCGRAIERVGELRRRLRARAPGSGGEVGKKRMAWMVEVCEVWELEELARLEEADMERLLDEGWERGQVPTPADLGKRSGRSARTGHRGQPAPANPLGISSAYWDALFTGLGAALGTAAVISLMLYRGTAK